MENQDQRHYLRFMPDNTATAILSDINGHFKDYYGNNVYAPDKLSALIYDESWKGCNLVLLKPGNQFILKPGMDFSVILGKQDPVTATLRWFVEPAPGILRLGMELVA